MNTLMDTTSLSHPRAVTSVKDPIHGSITLTSFEREIVDSEHFQRLHFILQNSTTYVAFPSNKNTRFCHSLGVMSFCGQILTSALRNATPQDLDAFLNTSAVLINEIAFKATDGTRSDFEQAWKQTISGHSEFRHRPSLRTAKNGSPLESRNLQERYPATGSREADGYPENRKLTAGFLIDAIWQAVRICGLVHDIGHLPMSHSLEGSLEIFEAKFQEIWSLIHPQETLSDDDLKLLFRDIVGGDSFHDVTHEFSHVLKLAYPNDKDLEKLKKSVDRFPLHERRSLIILQNLFVERAFKFDGVARNYRSLIYNIAFLILFSSVKDDQDRGKNEMADEEEPLESRSIVENTAFRFLKLIIAGSIDGDRMDYTIRDGHSCGSEIGNYDAQSIIENSTLFRDSRNNEFRMGFFYRALPAIEQFFEQRRQGYRYLIYHRTSSRSELCLQYVMSSILEFCFLHPTDEITNYFEALGYFERRKDGRHLIFPMHRSKIWPDPTGDGLRIPSINDANLRSFLEWTHEKLMCREEKEIGVSISTLPGRIITLLDIVLNRDFSSIYDPFKDSSITVRAFEAWKKAYPSSDHEIVSKAFNEAKKLIALSEPLRSEILEEFELALNKKIAKPLLFLHGEQKPKVYDHLIARSKGEEVYLVYNGVDSGGYVRAKPLPSVSPALKEMGLTFFRDYRINCYFVSRRIKRSSADLRHNSDVFKEEIEESIDLALVSAARIAIDSITKEAKKEKLNVQD